MLSSCFSFFCFFFVFFLVYIYFFFCPGASHISLSRKKQVPHLCLRWPHLPVPTPFAAVSHLLSHPTTPSSITAHSISFHLHVFVSHLGHISVPLTSSSHCHHRLHFQIFLATTYCPVASTSHVPCWACLCLRVSSLASSEVQVDPWYIKGIIVGLMLSQSYARRPAFAQERR